MSDQKVRILSSADALRLGRDAKIVAIRWDLVPWGLVLDCDAPVEEDVKNAPVRRTWMIFKGMHEISWSLMSARLPNGIFSTNALIVSERSDGFCKYEIPVLAPIFSNADKLSNNPHSKIIIVAKELVGATSIAMSYFGEFGPDRQQRDSLATEVDFLLAMGNVHNDSADVSRDDGSK